MPEAERFPNNEQLAEKGIFRRGNCDILRIIRLSAVRIIFRYTSKPEGSYLFYNPSLTSNIAQFRTPGHRTYTRLLKTTCLRAEEHGFFP